MNVYDFDQTIYAGDSTVDFYLWCLKRYPRCLLALPIQGIAAMRYLLKKCSKTEMKEGFYRFLRYVPVNEALLKAFWKQHEGKMQSWYIRQRRDDDVVISASPEFLLKPVCDGLGIALLASRVDASTGTYTGLNCHGAEKVRRFREIHPDAEIKNFYSDSLSDAPLAACSRQAYLVKGQDVCPWPEKE